MFLPFVKIGTSIRSDTEHSAIVDRQKSWDVGTTVSRADLWPVRWLPVSRQIEPPFPLLRVIALGAGPLLDLTTSNGDIRLMKM